MNPESLVDAALRRSPFQMIARRRTQRSLTILAYHGVDDVETFHAQLDFIVANCNPVSADEALASLDGASLPDRATLITFDDGERSVLEEGFPALQARGLPSVLFAIADLIDTDEPFWWFEAEEMVERGAWSARIPEGVTRPHAVVRYLKTVPDAERLAVLDELRTSFEGPPLRTRQLTAEELRELDRMGMRVENHTVTHPLLDQCPDDKVESEVMGGHERFTEILGRAPTMFAFPNGNKDPRAKALLGGTGYRAAFLFDHAISPDPSADPLDISRVRVGSRTSINRFATILSGLHPTLHRLRGGT